MRFIIYVVFMSGRTCLDNRGVLEIGDFDFTRENLDGLGICTVWHIEATRSALPDSTFHGFLFFGGVACQ